MSLFSSIPIVGDLIQNYENKKAANRQMDFQQYMSNTSYRRAVEDLEKAGLSKQLAYGQGGASTPPGSIYQAKAIGESAVSTALQVKQVEKELERLDSEISLNNANKQKSEADADLSRASARDVMFKSKESEAKGNVWDMLKTGFTDTKNALTTNAQSLKGKTKEQKQQLIDNQPKISDRLKLY